MKKIYLIIIVLFLCEIIFASAINKPTSSRFGFIENKGQIIDQNNNLNPVVKFLFNSNGLNVQLRSNGFSYDTYRRAAGSQPLTSGKNPEPNYKMPFAKSQEPTADSIYFHRVDIEFIYANKNLQIISEQPSSDYTNYYTTGTPEEGVTNVRTFQKVTYQNIYNGIDLEFHLSPDLSPKGKGAASRDASSSPSGRLGGVEYNFIIHPGADVSQIRWKYNGAFSTSLTDGKIIIQLAQGNLEEKIPESFIQETNEKVNVNYISFGENEFGFSSSSFDKNSTLVIDPVPWATYFGGYYNDEGDGITVDSNGNIAMAGSTSSLSSIATTGAYQTSFAGTYDAFVAKFDSSRAIQWASYYGGSSDDYCYGIAFDGNGNIAISGYTASTSGIATTGSYQTTSGGVNDAFVAKFNSSGTRVWATYYGGSLSEWCYGIAFDNNGNITITGNTSSTSGIATTGAYQTSLSGPSDAFVAKFNSSGAIQWASYYGGSSIDYCYGIAYDGSGNIAITGTTSSTSGIAATGAYQTSFAGTMDAFVAKFNSSGTRLWATYYLWRQWF